MGDVTLTAGAVPSRVLTWMALTLSWSVACSDTAEMTSLDDAAGDVEGGGMAAEAPVEIVDRYPGDTWATGDPADHGMDPEALQETADIVEGLDSHCFMVVHRGTVVGEWYWNGWDRDTRQEVFSASKSISSTLFGIAQARGLLDVDDPASEILTEWQGTDSEGVTIANLLSNDSGREWSTITDYVNLITLQSDKTAYALSLGQDYPPGEHWEYNNAAIQTLEPILEEATGMPVEDFAREALFEPLGMGSEYTLDAAGNAMMWQGVQASCSDLARFGLLFLRGGSWEDGQQIVPRAWVEEATTPRTDLNSAYGYLWWLNQEGHWERPSIGERTAENGGLGEGRWEPGDPEDVYMALGFQGQLVIVDPTEEVVYVRIGGNPDMLAAFNAAGGLSGIDSLAGGTEVTTIRQAMRAVLQGERPVAP